MKVKQLIILALSFSLFTLSCSKSNKQEAKPDKPAIEIPEGDVQVAVYYFPNWGPVYASEWSTVKAAKPQFNGHQQPKVPIWGYGKMLKIHYF
jgi:hypothetical protein